MLKVFYEQVKIDKMSLEFIHTPNTKGYLSQHCWTSSLNNAIVLAFFNLLPKYLTFSQTNIAELFETFLVATEVNTQSGKGVKQSL